MTENYNHIYDLCKKYMHSYVLAETVNGEQVDGIITGVDDENVYMAVPNDYTSPDVLQAHQQGGHFQQYRDKEDQRQFGYYGYPGYGYGGYGYGGPYYSPGPRFRRLILPLTAIAALSLLPWY